MKILTTFAFLCLMLSTGGVSSEKKQTAVKNNTFVMEQLFTSQGCSSCPSADRLLEKKKAAYRSNKNVVLLSYHVDYWDRLGWKDPFSQHAFTKLQQQYARSFNGSSVYTPEAVINGKNGFVGSNTAKLNSFINNALATAAQNAVEINSVSHDNGKIEVNYSVEGNVSGKNLQLALVIDHRDTPVHRGENGGKTLSNANVVVNQLSVTLHQKKGTAQIKIPGIVKNKDKLSVAAFVQQQDLQITGAVIQYVQKD